jgi:hypothetical protein
MQWSKAVYLLGILVDNYNNNHKGAEGCTKAHYDVFTGIRPSGALVIYLCAFVVLFPIESATIIGGNDFPK